MAALESEDALRACFREIDREEVELPEALAFPLEVGDFYAWALGPRAFLMFREQPTARPRGIVFHRSRGESPEVAAMCEWCHAVRGAGGVKLLTVNTDGRRRVGLYLCSDLSCMQHALEPPGPSDLPERLDVHQRMSRTLGRIAEFAKRNLS